MFTDFFCCPQVAKKSVIVHFNKKILLKDNINRHNQMAIYFSGSLDMLLIMWFVLYFDWFGYDIWMQWSCIHALVTTGISMYRQYFFSKCWWNVAVYWADHRTNSVCMCMWFVLWECVYRHTAAICVSLLPSHLSNQRVTPIWLADCQTLYHI